MRKSLVVLLLLATAAWPQASTTTVRGTVLDSSNAVVPDAGVTLTNTATNVARTTRTNAVGIYTIPGVIPGPYSLKVESPGMQTYQATLTARVQEEAVVDVTLSVGQAATQVTVQDVTPVVQVQNPSLGHVIEQKRIEQLPLNGRGGFGSLILTVPGMNGSSGFRAYGLRFGTAGETMDGAQQNEVWEGWEEQRPPGLDTVEEFRVEANGASAKYSQPTSIIMSSKSGTNELHGSIFEVGRNSGIGVARKRQDYWTKPPYLNRHEYGASGGGPVFIPRVYSGKNRTFWFFGWEANKTNSPTTQSFRVPTEAMRKGDFRGLLDSQGRMYRLYDPWSTDTSTWQRQPFAYGGQVNVIDPSRQSPLSKQLLAVTPMPTLPDVNPLIDVNWWGLEPNWTKTYTITTRIDHRFSDRDQLFARYTHNYARQYYQSGSYQTMLDGASSATVRWAPSKQVSANWVHMFSPGLFVESLISVNRDVQWRGPGDGGVTNFIDKYGLPNPLSASNYPPISGMGLTNYQFGGNNYSVFYQPFIYGQAQTNFTWVLGRHEFQFGAQLRHNWLDVLTVPTTSGSTSFSTGATSLYDPATSRTSPGATALTGYDLANMFIGVGNYSATFSRGWVHLRDSEIAGYFQDNFKVTSRLTLNLGVRYEFRPPVHDKNYLDTSFDLDKHAIVLSSDLDTMYRKGAALPSIANLIQAYGGRLISYKDAGLPRSLVYTNWDNIDPRLGFAYRIGGGKRTTAVRGGYRISTYATPYRSWSGTLASSPSRASFSYSVTSASLSPDGISNLGLRSAPTIIAGLNSRNAIDLNDTRTLSRGFAGVSVRDPHQPDGRVQDWNFTIEREVMSNTLLRAAYVGNYGGNMEQYVNYNDNPNSYVWYATTGLPLPTGAYSNVAERPYDQQVFGGIGQYTKKGYSNFSGMQFELERRFEKGLGFQLTYVVGNTYSAGGSEGKDPIPSLNTFLPGAVPTGLDQRIRFLNYGRDTGEAGLYGVYPKHQVRWNWIAGLPFGRGKWLAHSAGPVLDRFIGGWQVAGLGSLQNTFFNLPTNIYPNGNKIEIYGYKYPIQDCRSGACYPGYLWWNGYIPPNQINSVAANGKPNGVMGVPQDYKPAGQPLIAWPQNPSTSDPLYSYYGSNTIWLTLKDGTLQRTTYDNNLHPWRNQFFPSVRQRGLDASLFKQVPIHERWIVRFTMDFFNVLNHPGNPNSVGGDGVLSTRTSGSGARVMQLSLRMSW